MCVQIPLVAYDFSIFFISLVIVLFSLQHLNNVGCIITACTHSLYRIKKLRAHFLLVSKQKHQTSILYETEKTIWKRLSAYDYYTNKQNDKDGISMCCKDKLQRFDYLTLVLPKVVK